MHPSLAFLNIKLLVSPRKLWKAHPQTPPKPDSVGPKSGSDTCNFLKCLWSIDDTQCLMGFRCARVTRHLFCTFHGAPRKWSSHLSPHNAITAPSTTFPVLYLSALWFIHSQTGSLCLPLPFPHLAHLPISPLSGNHQFSEFIGLILLLFAYSCFFFYFT